MSPSAAPIRQKDVITSPSARICLALLRLAIGFVFLWAFLDKTFGLGYSTPPSKAWLQGGTPSQGFMKNVGAGPLQDFFISIASPASDLLFMLGMLGVGLAVMLGIGLRVAAVSGSALMIMTWIAVWPLKPGSTNPVVDDHLILTLSLIVIAVTYAGDTLGFGKAWRSLGVVKKLRWLI